MLKKCEHINEIKKCVWERKEEKKNWAIHVAVLSKSSATVWMADHSYSELHRSISISIYLTVVHSLFHYASWVSCWVFFSLHLGAVTICELPKCRVLNATAFCLCDLFFVRVKCKMNGLMIILLASTVWCNCHVIRNKIWSYIAYLTCITKFKLTLVASPSSIRTRSIRLFRSWS